MSFHFLSLCVAPQVLLAFLSEGKDIGYARFECKCMLCNLNIVTHVY